MIPGTTIFSNCSNFLQLLILSTLIVYNCSNYFNSVPFLKYFLLYLSLARIYLSHYSVPASSLNTSFLVNLTLYTRSCSLFFIIVVIIMISIIIIIIIPLLNYYYHHCQNLKFTIILLFFLVLHNY